MGGTQYGEATTSTDAEEAPEASTEAQGDGTSDTEAAE